ncbi:high mobility group B protein 10-like [Cornus florida]|uniref:high mobility group B protein 10-like n=1 Tax=Cornus florida TaxID=4283 RepID=UPI002896A809|nr:high mobility group B protein 10-like [Cornus florida]XP_059666608.1 high mobility group B protein 10-like [Cornus florida]XP_059666609.1 high mobility group B protein 10-like [Cornus florida]
MSTHQSKDPTTATAKVNTENDTVYALQALQSESINGESNATKSYPKPEAQFEEVARNAEIFLEKLKGFHRSFGTKFKVPTIGGRALDLHRLFVEVTSRGGIEKVIRDRKWKEVIGVFNFPSTITSASFVLRKYYLSLLYHFEQVYFFRKDVASISISDPVSRIPVNGSAGLHDDTATNEFPESPDMEPGTLVTGTIDAKFDNGYLITVHMGSEKLKGVLYHTPTEVNMSQGSDTSGASPHRNRKRYQQASRDLARPKPNRSGYNFFFSEQYTRLKPLYHGQEKAITKKIGVLWSRLTEAERQVYQDKGSTDKERYRTEMMEYGSSINTAEAQ